MIPVLIMLICSLLNVQEFDTGWDEIALPMPEMPSDDVLEVCTNWEYVSSRNSTELYDTEIHQKISMPNYHKLKTMVEKEQSSETTITKLYRQAPKNLNRSSGQESKGIEWR